MNYLLSIILALAIVAGSIDAFCVSQHSTARRATSLNQTVLSNSAGKKVTAKEGSPMKNVVGKLGVKPRYSCKK